MELINAPLEGMLIIEPRVFEDDRGYFFESWNRRKLASHGVDLSFVQDNESCSARGVLRGLHYQLREPQGKLVRVVAGKAWDVAVDLRPQSSTYRQWFGLELSAANRLMAWIPPGFAHGFLSMQDGTQLLYKCSAYYNPNEERTLAWNDPDLGIEWPLEADEPLLSAKDRAGHTMRAAEALA
jgi:dTDP-4-dehydrorhamnose 3,5-epimerase